METRQLKYFLAIAEHGSFSLASQRIGIAQPALSAQIAKLEGRLGCMLFERHARGVELTESGKKLHPQAEDIWHRIRSAEKDVCTIKKVSEVTIGIPTLTSTLLVAPLIESFRSNAPHIILRIHEAMGLALRDMLFAKKLDMAIVYNAPSDDFPECETLCEEELYVGIASHCPSSWEGAIARNEVLSLPLILSTPGNSHRLLIDDLARRKKIALNVIAEVDSITGQKDLVMKGIGGAVLPLAGFSDWPQENLRLLPIPGKNLITRVNLVRPTKGNSADNFGPLTILVRNVVNTLIRDGSWRGARLHN